MLSLYRKVIKHQDVEFDSEKVMNILITLKHCKSEKARHHLLMKLFFLLSKVTIKGINNFFHLTKHIDKKDLLHNHEDIVSECFWVFQKCATNWNRKKNAGFHFYYNSGLNRHIMRLCNKTYNKHNPNKINVSDNMFMFDNRTTTVDMNELIQSIDLKQFSFLEQKLILFKYEGEKKIDFMRKYKKNLDEDYLSKNEIIEGESKPTTKELYDEMEKNIKIKLKTIYKDVYRFNEVS